MKIPIALAIASFMIAGCNGSSQGTSDSSTRVDTTTSGATDHGATTSPSVTTTPTSVLPPLINGTLPTVLEFNDCTGGGSVYTFAPGQSPGRPVHGWGEGDSSLPSQDFFLFFQCARIHWGPFERGPIRLIAETHDYESSPQTCLQAHPPQSGLGQMEATWRIWLNDAELAAWANSTFGGPFEYGNIELLNQTTSGLVISTWSLTAKAGDVSSVTLTEYQLARSSGTFLERLAWYGQGKWTLFDLYHATDDERVQNPIITGTMGASTLYAHAGHDPYVGKGILYGSVALQGNIWQYKDAECTQPA